jgi:hypothetical protein
MGSPIRMTTTNDDNMMMLHYCCNHGHGVGWEIQSQKHVVGKYQCNLKLKVF